MTEETKNKIKLIFYMNQPRKMWVFKRSNEVSRRSPAYESAK